MALQCITELNSYSSFSDILVFVCICLSHVFVTVFVVSVFTKTMSEYTQNVVRI